MEWSHLQYVSFLFSVNLRKILPHGDARKPSSQVTPDVIMLTAGLNHLFLSSDCFVWRYDWFWVFWQKISSTDIPKAKTNQTFSIKGGIEVIPRSVPMLKVVENHFSKKSFQFHALKIP